MNVNILQVSYDSGHRGERMGKGPEHLAQNGLVTRLWALRHQVKLEQIEAEQTFTSEIGTAVDLARGISAGVRRSGLEGAFPLVLAGNCSSAWGTLAGLGPEEVGIVWFDAHGDFNTPETTVSGFLDGMALAGAAGLCWKNLLAEVTGFRPVKPENIIHVGGRDFDPAEIDLLQEAGVELVSAGAIRERGSRAALSPAVEKLAGRVGRIYLHLDLDVLDPDLTPANMFRAPGGLTGEQAIEAVQAIKEFLPVAACNVTSYDPVYDVEGFTLQACLEILQTVLLPSDQGEAGALPH